MVKFGIYMKNNILKEWEKNYIDYNKLKDTIISLKSKYKTNLNTDTNQTDTIPLLTDHNRKTDDLDSDSNLSSTKKMSSYEKTDDEVKKNHSFKYKDNPEIETIVDDFLTELEHEIKKFFSYYQLLEKKMYKEVNKNLSQEVIFDEYSITQFYKETISLHDLCDQLKEICNFVNINVTAVRKILKKFDKVFNIKKDPVSIFYFGKILEDSNSPLRYILSFKCIDDSSALIEKIISDLEFSLNKKLENDELKKEDFDKFLEEPLLHKDLNLDELRSEEKSLVKKKLFNKINEVKAKLEEVDSANDMIRTSVEMWTLVVQNNLRMINSNYAEFKRFKNEKEMKNYNNEILIKNLTSQVKKDHEKPHHIVFNILFCLLHTCLNSMNSTIVFATNSSYIASIGSNSFMTGIVIGATHFAAIGFTFIYSSWTNNGYKAPLIFSCIVYIFGNLFYCYSGVFQSLLPMTIGRFLMGVGSARVVNRRYLIDHVEENHLLYYSMMYVVMTSLGHVLGPLCSVFFLFLPRYTFFNGWVVINEFTWPTWTSTIIWVVLIIMALLFFNEPENLSDKHVKEIEMKENKKIEYFDEINDKKELLDKENKTPQNENINKESNNNENKLEADIINNNSNNINSSTGLEFVRKDIQEIIKEQETSVFSYMTLSFSILIFTLFIIRVS